MFQRTHWIVLVLCWIAVGCGGEPSADSRDEDLRTANQGGAPPDEQEVVEVVVPAGTVFGVALDQSLSSESNSPGDRVQGHVLDEVRSEGETVIPQGAKVSGVITEVEGSDRIKGRAMIALNFTSVETLAGMREVETTMVDGTLKAPGTKKRDAAIIIGGAAAGAVIGEILGDNAKLGSIIGAAGGTGVVLATKGKELEVEPGTRLNLKLVQPLELTTKRGGASG